MKRRILIFLIFICGFYSCKKEIQLNFSEIEITTESNSIVEINIPHASGDEIISDTINANIENFIGALLVLGEPQDSIKTTPIKNQIDLFNTSYKEFSNDFPENNQSWEAQIDGEVTFSSPEIITLAITSYINTGGAHGSTNISFLNFDTSTGNLIKNTQLFKDIDAFKKVSKTEFDKIIEDKSILFEPDTFSLPANMGYTDEGIILLYNPYEIAPYSQGIIEFTIPFEKVSDILAFNSF